jgi:hypothetical protein
MLAVKKKVIVDEVEYEGYEIFSVEWELKNNLFGVKVIYTDNDTETKKLKTHYFRVGDDVNINEIIDEIHKLHGKDIL